MAMPEQQQRAVAVLPPPPSTPDDGPAALELPPLEPPPRSLQVSAGRAHGRLSFGALLLVVAVFVAGTVITFLVAR
jgi:hypothetical protein